MSVPRHWWDDPQLGEQRARFASRLKQAARPVLICDYDGTLAPFKADKMQAFPYAGIEDRLRRIHAGRTRLVLVSGRPVSELLQMMPLAAEIEIWGSHGREQRLPNGAYRLFEASAEHVQALGRIEAALHDAGYSSETERKSASIAVHWRNLEASEARELERQAREIFAGHAVHEGFAVMPFESGIELRVADRTKAHAVESVLAGARPGAAAYLGDDTTDEDAFGALGSRGLSVLVREAPRESLAGVWLRPPAELLRFLDAWLDASERLEQRR